MSSPRKIRIFLVYRLRVLADCLASTLAPEPELELEYRSWRDPDLPQALDRWPADLALLDTRIATNRSRSLHRFLESRYPSLKIVPIGLENRDEILEWIEAGARGFLSCSTDLSQFRSTLREIHLGRAPCSPEIAGAVLERMQELKGSLSNRPESTSDSSVSNPARRPQAQRLTAREQDVLRLIGAGLQNKEIARRLEISLATVKNHVHRILEKLGASRRREAFRLASDQELLRSPPPAKDL